MTSAIFTRPASSARPGRGASRRPMRGAAVAAVLVGALALTACSSDGGSDDDASATPSTTAASGVASTGSATGGTSSASAAASPELEGSWLATADGKAVALIVTGTQAALFVTGGTVCSGTAGEEAGMQMIHLTCTSGSKDRTTGMVGSVDAKSLEVTWSGTVGKETYTKAEGGQLPSGLPTAGLSQ